MGITDTLRRCAKCHDPRPLTPGTSGRRRWTVRVRSNLGDAWEGMAAEGLYCFGRVGPGSEASIRNMCFLEKAIADGSENPTFQ